jgi:SAM-dependent methyltransferase
VTTDGPGLVARAKELGCELDEARATRLLAYLDAMLVLNEHDGLAFARTGLRPRHALDIGSGNGFPGVAIAALHPGASVVLCDRTAKKVRAIGSCLVQAKLDGVETLQLDAQQAPALRTDLRHAFDLATARAVGKPEAVAELAAPLVRPGGHLVLWLDADAPCPERIGPFRRKAKIDYELPAPAARHRVLGVWQQRM